MPLILFLLADMVVDWLVHDADTSVIWIVIPTIIVFILICFLGFFVLSTH